MFWLYCSPEGQKICRGNNIKYSVNIIIIIIVIIIISIIIIIIIIIINKYAAY